MSSLAWAADILDARAIPVQMCGNLQDVLNQSCDEVGVLLLSDDAIEDWLDFVQATPVRQSPWAEVPVIVVAAVADHEQSAAHPRRERLLELSNNVLLLEQPLGAHALLSAAQFAIRARQAQIAARGSLKAEQAERERAEESLRQAQKMEVVGQLTGGIAHDFNNMLTGVVGSLDILRRRMAAGRLDDVNRFMDAAATSAGRAAALTQRLLAFSRRQPADLRPVAVSRLIYDMKDLLERAVDERISLKFDLPDALPNAVVDSHQLESAILNLTINARDAMPDGGELTIATRLVPADAEVCSYIEISVADTGIGMPPDVLEKIFEPFFTTKPPGQGTGLGLSMVYDFAQQSGGRVLAESRPNVGTRVQICLPITQSASWTTSSALSRAEEGAGERVLVVEDDQAVLILIREVLEELNYQTIEARGSLEALPLLASQERIDLMISDVGLPGMNGRQLADAAREYRPDLPILFVTGYSESTIGRDLLKENMTVISKPFSLDHLSVRIKQMIMAHPKTP